MKINKNIEPIWKNYRNWECYKNGMYENGNDIEIIKQCFEILTDDNLKDNMSDTAKTYETSAEIMFTNQRFNPISWLGQATCNLLIGATAQETCQAWMLMTKEQQDKANNIAKEVIEEWRKNYESVHR